MDKIIITSTLFAFASTVIAQQVGTGGYPTWVTNDYPCVIQCIEDQYKDAQPPATADKTDAAMGCVRDACSKDTAEGNVYQAHYIINMFNTIGSIYEPESWQAGNAPDAKDLVAPEGWTQTQVTTAWTEQDKPTTVTTSVWVPPQTQQNVVETSAPDPASAPAPSGSVAAGGIVASHSTSKPASVSGPHPSGGNSSNSTEEGAGSRRIVPVDMGVSALAGLGAMLLGGIAGGVGLLGL